jgi:hypothetical protein
MIQAKNEVDQLLEQYNLAMNGDAWYGDPVWKILDGIDARCATAQMLPGVHSIWQLLRHMEFWEKVAVERAAGPVKPDLTLNFPETSVADGTAWQQAVEDFGQSNREFRELLTRLDPARLDENTPGGDKSFRVELLGVLHHHIYHAGQIAILKKAYKAGVAGGL